MSLTTSDSTQVFADEAAYTTSVPEESSLDREGWRPSGPPESELRKWAGHHGDRVRIETGVAHADVAEHLNAMDLLCAPSQTTVRWREQFGRLLIEALSCGVPVIASDSGEIPDVLADAGVVVGEGDEQAWTRTLRDLSTILGGSGICLAAGGRWPLSALPGTWALRIH